MFLATGVIPLGKTQLSEYGFSASAEHPRLGPVRSPWSTEPHRGRLVGRLGGAGRRRRGPAGARQRRRRLDPHPGRGQRARRSQADPGPARPGPDAAADAGPGRGRRRRHPVGARHARRSCARPRRSTATCGWRRSATSPDAARARRTVAVVTDGIGVQATPGGGGPDPADRRAAGVARPPRRADRAAGAGRRSRTTSSCTGALLASAIIATGRLEHGSLLGQVEARPAHPRPRPALPPQPAPGCPVAIRPAARMLAELAHELARVVRRRPHPDPGPRDPADRLARPDAGLRDRDGPAARSGWPTRRWQNATGAPAISLPARHDRRRAAAGDDARRRPRATRRCCSSSPTSSRRPSPWPLLRDA